MSTHYLVIGISDFGERVLDHARKQYEILSHKYGNFESFKDEYVRFHHTKTAADLVENSLALANKEIPIFIVLPSITPTVDLNNLLNIFKNHPSITTISDGNISHSLGNTHVIVANENEAQASLQLFLDIGLTPGLVGIDFEDIEDCIGNKTIFFTQRPEELTDATRVLFGEYGDQTMSMLNLQQTAEKVYRYIRTQSEEDRPVLFTAFSYLADMPTERKTVFLYAKD